MLDDGDKQEATNIQEEEAMSAKMYGELTRLSGEGKALRKEFKQLLKIGKKLRNIIAAKEKENKGRLEQIKRLQQQLTKESVKDIQAMTRRLQEEKRQESGLSKEEALVLKSMLDELKHTYQHGNDIIAADKKLYELIRDLYAKDLEDFQLEVAEIEKG